MSKIITKEQEINICWLRRDLRLKDNAALYHALKSDLPVLVIFIFDTMILNNLSEKKDRRVAFIHQTLKRLNSELKTHDSSLYILNDEPVKAFEKIVEHFKVRTVFTNHDYEPYAIQRDTAVKNFLTQKNISFHTYKDQVIFEKSEVIKADGSPYTVFTPFARAWKQKLREEPLHGFVKLKSFYPIF